MSINELVDALRHENFLVRSGAIWEVANRRVLNDDIILLLKKLKKDETVFWPPVKVQDLAFAALDILGIEKYSDDNAYVKGFIKTKMKK